MNYKPKQILIVSSEFPPLPGGIGNHAHNLAKHLSIKGYDVLVLTDQRSANIEEDLKFDKKQLYRIHRISKTKPRFPMYFFRIYWLFTLSKRVDIVLATGKFSLWSVGFLSFFKRKFYVAVVHGSEVNFKSLLPKTLVGLSLKRFDHVIAVSNFTKALMNNLNLKKIKVIPNGCDVSDWGDVVPIKSLTGFPKLITVGHVSKRKGQGNVIALLPELIKLFPNLHYHCVGIPTEASRFTSLAKKLGVLSHVTFHGRMSQEKLQSSLLDSDIFVLLSGETDTGDVEGFGIVLLEANTLGIPVIAGKGSGVEDAVDDGFSGFLVPLDDSLAFGEAMKILLKRKDEFHKQAKVWSAKFKWEIIVNHYLDVFNVLDVE